jgi:hypothetical protein
MITAINRDFIYILLKNKAGQLFYEVSGRGKIIPSSMDVVKGD